MELVYQIFTVDADHNEFYVSSWSNYNKAIDKATEIAEGYRLSRKLSASQIGKVNFMNRVVWTAEGQPIVTVIIRTVER